MISQIEIIYIIFIILLSIILFFSIINIIIRLSFDRYIYLLSNYSKCGKEYPYTFFSNIYYYNATLVCINITERNGALFYAVRYLVPKG